MTVLLRGSSFKNRRVSIIRGFECWQLILVVWPVCCANEKGKARAIRQNTGSQTMIIVQGFFLACVQESGIL